MIQSHNLPISALFLFICLSVLFVTGEPVTAQSGTEYLEVGIQHQTDVFSAFYDPQYITGIHAGIQRSHGKYMLRVNAANRFEQTGVQVEAEAYPRFGKGFYSYLNYAYSGSSVLPVRRGAAELYIPLRFIRSELSLGGRYLLFDSEDDTYIVTGSINHYVGSFLLIFRPFFIFSDGNYGETFTGSLRYFLNDRGDYFLIRGGAGFSSDRLLFQLGGTGIGEDLLLLESNQIGAEFRHHVGRHVIGTLGFDMNRQELLFARGDFVTNWSIFGGIMYRF